MTKLSVETELLKAKSHVKRGETEEARKLYQTVLQVFPKNKRAQQGLASLKKSKRSTAPQGPPQFAINQLVNLYRQGQLAAVVEQATSLTQQYPKASNVWNLLGTAAAQTGKLNLAITAFQKLIGIKPDYADAYNNMGNALKEQGNLEKAIEAYNKALSLKPDYAEAHNNMGNALKEQKKIEKAIKAYNKALSLKPIYAEAHNNMGVALKEQGNLKEAIKAHNKALSLKPEYAEAHNNMGNALQEQGKLKEAIEAYDKALSLKPDYAEAYYNMGNALREQGKLAEAIEAYDKTLSLKPDYAEVHNNKGIAFQEQGNLEKAIEAYKKTLLLKPDYAGTHRNLSALIKYEVNHPQVATVAEMMKRSDLKDDDRCHLIYAYAKMMEDLGNLEVAFENYEAGGRLRQKILSYESTQDQHTFHNIKLTAPKLKDVTIDNLVGTTLHTPIFILGMPRSGTTLVEQIISSHSLVQGGGELPFLDRFASLLSRGNQIIDTGSILQVRKAYLNELEKVSNKSPFVTDKTPHNFLHIDLILAAIPEAKIIHVQRDPAATCWSNFKYYFSTSNLGYSYNLDDTIHYFKMYQDLMVYWEQQYAGQIYHLDYDRLTKEQETETRKLIGHLDLKLEEACLSPQKNKRSVRTASQQQVRKKIYKDSSQAWRKFEPYLNGAFDEFIN